MQDQTSTHKDQYPTLTPFPDNVVYISDAETDSYDSTDDHSCPESPHHSMITRCDATVCESMREKRDNPVALRKLARSAALRQYVAAVAKNNGDDSE